MNLETHQTVHTIVEQLPDNLRMVLILSYSQDCPIKKLLRYFPYLSELLNLAYTKL